jgi:hypothetical protein
MTHGYFTEQEARRLVGQRIRSLIPFAGVPPGTEGQVKGADPSGGDPQLGWTVAIQWDLPRHSKPLVDWFSKDEYLRFLEMI